VRKLVFACLLAACGVAEPIQGFAQTADTAAPVFKSSVDLVPISAVVRDRRGRLVSNLTAADFQILDKGEPRRIVDFQLDHSSAVSVAVLLDMSGSMRMGPKLAFARAVLDRIAAELQDGSDELALFTFDASLYEREPFTSHPAAIDTSLEGAQPFGTTSLYDAVAATAKRLIGRSSRRRAIVVLTDGLDTSSSLTAADVSALASSIDVPVYVVATVASIDHVPDDVARQAAPSSGDLRDLAAWTGGDMLWATGTDGAAVSAHQILVELRQQYLIAIESASLDEWRPIDVRVRDRRMTVRARSGYFSRDNSLSR
jgi:Ca-activated chloride channel family protein